MYFLYKECVYGHGVFWIGDDEDEGRKAADDAAKTDRDSHHDWVLYKFIKQNGDDFNGDGNHEEIYRTEKSKQE